MSTQATLPAEPETSAPEQDQAVTLQAAQQEGAGQQNPTKSVDEMTWEEAWAEMERLNADQLGNGAPPIETPETPVPEATPQTGTPAVSEEPADGPNNFRISVKNRDDIDRKVIALIAHNPDMDIATALAKVTGQTSSPAASQTPDATETPATETLESITARQEALNAELLEAHNQMDLERAGQLQVEAIRLIEQKMIASQQQAQAAASKQATVEAEWDRYEAQAAELYPDAAKDGSPLHQQMLAIYATLQQAGDPLVGKPECTLRIAQMAAGQLAIPPATVKVAAPVTLPAATTVPKTAPVRPRPMDGGSSQGAPNPVNQDAALKQLERFTPEQWHAFNQQFS
jgi:hypothetical protein